jgi:3-oxoadipate enol-lactonase
MARALSPDPDDLFCRAHPADLARLLDHLQIERVVLVGQSLGGWSVVGCALDRPELVCGLVLSGTPGGTITAAMDRRIRSTNGKTPLSGDRWPSQPDLDRTPERAFLYDQIQRLGARPPDDAGSRLRAMNFNVEIAVSKLKMPVLCIVGEHDDVFPLDVIRELTVMLPDARLVTVSGCGHSAYFDKPDVFNRALGEFLISIGYKA